MAPSCQRLILMGLRASGKTNVGRLVAARLNTAFVDLDELAAEVLEQPSAGAAIERLGLRAFREGETRALRLPRAWDCGVLALGGGTPTAPGAAILLRLMVRRGARLVYLRAAPQTLRARLSVTDLSKRPSLTGADPLEEIDSLFKSRDGLYRSIASTVIDVDAMDEHAVADALAGLAAG